MRRIDRNFNIFNLSMLDVMTGALGAVMAIMVVLLTQKIGVENESCQDLKSELMTTTSELINTRDELVKTREELQSGERDKVSAYDKIVSVATLIRQNISDINTTIESIKKVKIDFSASPEDKGVMAFKIPKNVVMLVDLSGSMAPDKNDDKEDRLSQVKAAIKMYIASMDQEYKIDIVFFPAFKENVDSAVCGDFKVKPDPDQACFKYGRRDDAYDNESLSCYKYGFFEGNLKPLLSENDKYYFYQKVSCLKPYHDTPTKQALEFVLTSNRYASAEGVILFSDGEPDVLRKKMLTLDQFLVNIKRMNGSGKKIFTVGIGSEFRNKADTTAVKFLRDLAAQNNGFFLGF
jgi:hypothetical protein